MDEYIEARLERAERYLNNALDASKGITKPLPGQEPDEMIKAGLSAAFEQVKKIERYIYQCQKDEKENEQYLSVIE